MSLVPFDALVQSWNESADFEAVDMAESIRGSRLAIEAYTPRRQEVNVPNQFVEEPNL